MGDEGQQEVEAAAVRLAGAVDAEALGAEIADLVIAKIPALAGRADEDLRQAAIAAGIQSVADAMEGLRAGIARDEVVPPWAGTAFAIELVRRGVDLGALLRAWRLGHGLFEARLQEVAEQLDAAPEVRLRAFNQVVRWSFLYVDAVSVQLAEAYAEERARWVRGAAAVRAEMLDELLGGGSVPTGVASRALGYDVGGRHIAFVLWAEPHASDAGSDGPLETTAAIVAAGLGDGPSMLQPVGNWAVWGWVTVSDAISERPGERLAMPEGVRVAIAGPADGLAGFVRAHEEAMAARRVAGLRGRRSATVVRHPNVALLALLTADPVAAQRFVESELGALAGDDDSAARLRATLRVYLEENASPARTSRRLSVNKNTVVYRVNRAEELLGRPLTRRPELDVALLLMDVLDGLRDTAPRPATG